MEKGSSSASESLNGLKFGKKIYFEDVGSGLESKSGSGSLSSPAKKGRSGVAHGGQPPRCQVEGCMVDLSDAKAYYSRHKVCGMHSKSSKVIVAGIEQRFCQQCSRFHKLPEFDQGKRSCRRRLACHNERRRKPPAGSLLSSHFGSLSPTATTSFSPNMFDNQRKTGGFLMDFTTFTTPAQESWQNTTERGFRNHQLPWQNNLQNPLPNILQSPTTRPTYSNPEAVSPVDRFVSDSNSALSLLSIQQPWGSRTRSSSLNGFLGTNANANANANATSLFHPSVNPIGQFTCPPDLGLGQINGQYNNGELGLGQPSDGRFLDLDHSRGNDSFV